MRSFDNIYKLHRLLSKARQPVSLDKIKQTLECSKNTVIRTINELRDSWGAPIEHRRDPPAGYRYTNSAYELPGIWLSPPEMQSLLLVLTLLEAFAPGLLQAAFAPIRRKLSSFLGRLGMTPDVRARIRLLGVAVRPAGPSFETVATALFQRRRLTMRYVARSTGKASRREVSPQRLVNYRGNWYLDAWCHGQEGLRIFALDCIESAEAIATAALDIPSPRLDRELGAGYGIFSGPPAAIARLRFTPERARWVAAEQWHPDQKGYFEASGHYVLEVPYSRADELILDILRYGPDVEALAPLDLRQAVAERHRAAAAQYN